MEVDEAGVFESVRRTILEMCKDRGYQVPEVVASKEEMQKYLTEYQTVGHFMMFLDQNDKKVAVIVIKSDSQISERSIEGVANRVIEADIYRAVLVSNRSLTSSAEKLLKKLENESKLIIEFFTTSDLMINITHHEMVPRHIVCTREEKELVLKKYKAKESQLPKILVSDPVARYYGIRKGELMKIIRTSETAGLHVVYRICI